MLIGSVLIKGILLAAWQVYLKRFYQDVRQRLCVAWLLSYISMLGVMIVLSPLHLVSRWPLAVGMLLVAAVVLVLWRLRKPPAPLAEPAPGRENSFLGRYPVFTLISLIPILLVLAGLVFHSFYYYDTTSDGLMQGMPKLAFIQQAGSLFVRYDTVSVNIFGNECLGEMNGLFYLLMTGSDLSMLLGNAELWAVTYFLFLYVVRAFGYEGRLSGLLAASGSLVYVVAGLALTVKTDMIATCLPAVAVAMLVTYYQREQPEDLFAAILFLGATAASKVSVLPMAGLLLLVLVWYYFLRAKTRPVAPVVLGAAGCLVLCNRYAANIIQYGNPFVRAANEKMAPSLDNLLNNLQGLVTGFTEGTTLWATRPPAMTSNWAVCRAFGYLGLTAIAFMVVAVYIGVRGRDGRNVYRIGLPSLFALLFFMSSTPWYDWSFRYMAGYAIAAYLYVGARVFLLLGAGGRPAPRVGKAVLALLMVVTMVGNGVATFRYGQPIPTDLETQKSLSRPLRKILYADMEKMEEWEQEEELLYILDHGGTALLSIEFAIPFYMYFGTDHCVQVDMVLDEPSMVDAFWDKSYDIVVLCSAQYDPESYPALEQLMTEQGYTHCGLSTAGVFLSPAAVQRARQALG